MGDRHDYVALEWVKGEIAETLKQARQALEAFVENPQDATRMRFCQTYVHQVHGTLQMVEFYGAALLAEEMEQLTQALLDGRVGNQNEALEVLMQAILQLPAYLDRIQSARRDLPMVVLPLLNDLRAARGENLLSETSLFSPDLSGRLPALSLDSLEKLRTAELPVLLRKLRQMLQMALVGVIRSQDLATNLGYMARVFARLETLCKEAPLGPLWQIASGMVEGLANGSVVNSASVRTLLRQVDKELKRLVDQGADGINQGAPDELTKNLLFYVAKAPAQSPRIRALKEQYRLDDALPDSGVVDEERARLAGPDRDAMRSVVGALCEELVRVKDSLDLFVRSDRKQVAELDALLAPLKQIADTLAVLGFGQPRKVILDQIDVVHALSLGQREPNDAVLMDVAGALLYVEATLAGMVGPGDEAQNEQSHLPTTDVAQIHQLVIKEARTGLEQAKDAIIEFIASQWNHEHLARVPELLTQVRGGLAMIPLSRAADLLKACTRYIEEQLLVRKAVPNWQNLDTLADAITSVEYYLERLAEDHATQGDLILDVAEESLETLGYPLKDRPSILDRIEPREEVPAPLADPLQDIEVLAAEDVAFEPPTEEQPLAMEELPALVSDELSAEFAELPVDDGELLVSDDNWSLGEAVQEGASGLDLSLDAPLELTGLDDLQPLVSEPRALSPEQEPSEFLVSEELPSLGEALPSEAEELNLESASDNWDELEIGDLELPEVELPIAQIELPSAPEPVEKPMTMAEVMAAPVQAINPPAQDVPPSLLPPPADEEPVDEDLLEVFIEEAGEVLETINEYLPRWRANTDDKDALTEVRRAFHTLKGSGRMVRALIIGELAWSIENMLNRVLDRSIQPDQPVQQVIVDVVQLMPALVDEFAAKAQRQRDDVDRLAAIAHALARGQVPSFASTPAVAELQSEPAESPQNEEIEVAATASTPAPVDEDDGLDPLLLDIFRNEAETHLDTLVGFLADCAQELPQPVTDDLQRALHTLKGSAHMAGILPIAEIATPLEKLVKEFKTNLIDMDLAEAELLRDAEQLFRAGLEQLESHPLAVIPGAAEFLERAQKLHHSRLDSAESARLDEQDHRDPQLISIFLAEGMDILLDAEDLLRKWREHPSEQQELSALLEELTTLGRGAEMAELPQINELCQALLALYQAVLDGRLAVSEHFFSEAEAAHEALIGQMDQVAAALQVSPQPERVAALRNLLDQALDPATLALLDTDNAVGLEVVELEELPAEPQDETIAFEPESALVAEPEIVFTEPEPIAPLASMPEDLDAEMVEIFLEEAVDILDSAGQALDRWLADPDSTLPLSSLQRDLHTLKGGARMAEIRAIGDLAHELESLYEGLVDRRFSYSPGLASLLQSSHDRLAVVLEQLQRNQPLLDSTELIDAIRSFRQGGTIAAPSFSASDESLRAVPELEADAAESMEIDLGELAEVDFLAPQPDELPALHIEIAAPAEGELPTELPALSSEQWHLEESLPALGGTTADEQLVVEPELPSTGPLDESSEIDLSELAEVEFVAPQPDELPELHIEAGVMAEEELPTELPAMSSDEWHLDESLPALGAEDLSLLAEPLPSVEAAEPEPEPEATVPVTAPSAVAPAPVVDRDPELVEIFLEEGFDIMDSASAALQRWMTDVDNILEVESLQRDLHTLKGGARMAEIREIGDLAHELEFLYEGVGDGRLKANSDLFGVLQTCHDRLSEMLDAVRGNRAIPDGLALIETIKRFRSDPSAQLSMPTSVHLQPVQETVETDDENDEILDIFLEEGDDLLEAMEATVGRWEANREDGSAIDELLRILHTLKGGARLAGQKRLGDLSHDLEQHLTEAQQQGAPWPESLFLDVQSGFEGLQQELDQLRKRLDEHHVVEVQSAPAEQAQPVEPGPAPVALSVPLVAASSQPQEQQENKVLPFVQRAAEAAARAAAQRAPQELVKVPAELLEGLVNLAGETSIFRGRVEQQVSDVGFTLGEMEATIERVRDQLRRLDTETQAQILSRYQAEAERAGYEDFDPLEMDRHSQLQQLSRALFESASDLLDLKETLAAKNRDAETLLLQQARVNTELQEGLMRTRMVPFDRLVPRLRRIVRQVAGELGKQVEFHVGNAEGEMDRTVLERIVAPLEHMLRNAVDHGIESVDKRRAAGKSEVGNIRLSLGREGGDILLTLADDGGGIRLDAVRRKAIERGMMDEGSDLSDHEILQFILEAGFSTAEKVTQISGRGVGMDVVHSEVKQLGGSMSIESTVGEGTRFLIRLPFTVSVNRALMVMSGEDFYAIPLNTIEGIVRVSPYELEAYYGPDAPRFEYAGQAYELKYLGDLLNNGQQPKLVGQSLPLPVILVRSSEHAVAVQVDALAGSREIVVKSLGPQFAGVHGISGATILGDGRVVVILDLLATIRVRHAHLLGQVQAPRLASQAPVAAEVDTSRPTLVMVVDDSVTVRKVTSRLLERNGMNVLTAKDGVDAIAQLQEHKPDIMLLDIEMPRMDGFEVATLVRHDERLKDLPIIMITSRTGEKHRERAMAIGVNEYLGKPYQESDLLDNILKLVKDKANG